jgi:hypothetical protein
MSEPKWKVLGKKIEPRWGPERARPVHAGIARRRVHRRMVTAAGVCATALAMVGAGWRVVTTSQPSERSSAPTGLTAPEAAQLAPTGEGFGMRIRGRLR